MEILIFSRKNILSKINKCNEWIEKDIDENIEVIKQNLSCINNYLELSKITLSMNSMEMKNRMGYLTIRQTKCMMEMNENIRNNEIQNAYHELYDFIDGFKNKDENIDMVERMIIKNYIREFYIIFNL